MSVEYSIDKSIGIISFDSSSEKKIASPIFAEHTELSQFLAIPSLKGVMIRDTGQRFWEGTDIDYKNIFHEICFATIPVAAVISGHCYDTGLLIALSCHFRFASESAQFRFSISDKNLTTLCDKVLSQQSVKRSKEITSFMRSGKTISAKEAKNTGIVDRVISTVAIEKTARDYLTSLTEKRTPHLIRTIMQSIHNSTRLPEENALHQESIFFDEIVRNSIS